MKKLLIGIFFISLFSLAETPPPGAVQIRDALGNEVTTNTSGSTVGLDVYVMNSTSSTVNQGTGGVSPWLFNLGEVGGSIISLGQTTMANGIPVTLASNQSAIPVTVSGSVTVSNPSTNYALETGGNLATIANAQGTGGTGISEPTGGSGILGWLSGIYKSLINTLNVNITNSSVAVTQSTSPWVVSGTVTATPSGNYTVVQPTAANLNATVVGSGNFTVVQPTGSNLHVDVDSAPTTTVTGTVTANIGTTNGLALDTSVNSLLKPASTLAAVTSITNPVTVAQSTAANLNATVVGTVTANAGTNLNTSALALSATQTNGTQKTQVVDGSNNTMGPVQTVSSVNYMPVYQATAGSTGSTIPAKANYMGGLNSGNLVGIAVDSSGRTLSDTFDGSGNAITSTTINGKTGLSHVLTGQDYETVTGTSTSAYTSTTSTFVTSGSQASGSTTLTLTTSPSSSLIGYVVTGSANIPANDYIVAVGTNSVTLAWATTGVIATTTTLTATSSLISPSTTGNCIAKTAVHGYRSWALDVYPGSTSNTFTATYAFYGSNDGTNWYPVSATQTGGTLFQAPTVANNIPVASNTTQTHYAGALNYNFFEVVTSGYTSGTMGCTATFSPLPFPMASMGAPAVSVPGGLSVNNTVNTNPGAQTFSAQVASAAHVSSGNSGTITQTAPNNNAVFEVSVTAVSGTNPTLDLVFQESPDGGTTWFDEWHWQRITGTGVFPTPNLTIGTNRFRFVWTIGGTTPSFTFVVNSNQGTGIGQIQRRFFDRTINLNSTSTPTASFYTDGCRSYNFTVSDSACTVFPTLALACSEDNSSFATTTDTLALTTNGTFQSSAYTNPCAWIQVQTTVAGTGCTLGYIAMRCTQY